MNQDIGGGGCFELGFRLGCGIIPPSRVCLLNNFARNKVDTSAHPTFPSPTPTPNSNPQHVSTINQWKSLVETSPQTPQASVYLVPCGSHSTDKDGRVQLYSMLTITITITVTLILACCTSIELEVEIELEVSLRQVHRHFKHVSNHHPY